MFCVLSSWKILKPGFWFFVFFFFFTHSVLLLAATQSSLLWEWCFFKNWEKHSQLPVDGWISRPSLSPQLNSSPWDKTKKVWARMNPQPAACQEIVSCVCISWTKSKQAFRPGSLLPACCSTGRGQLKSRHCLLGPMPLQHNLLSSAAALWLWLALLTFLSQPWTVPGDLCEQHAGEAGVWDQEPVSMRLP